MSKKTDNKWERPEGPPPPLFTGKPERDFQKQISDELLERVVSQQLIYFAIDINNSKYHPLYGECLKKVFYPPIVIKSILVEFEDGKTETGTYGMDKKSSMIVHFSSRRINEDQNLYVREGDFVKYGEYYYEIVSLVSPRPIFGQIEQFRIEISAKCIRARKELFNIK